MKTNTCYTGKSLVLNMSFFIVFIVFLFSKNLTQILNKSKNELYCYTVKRYKIEIIQY